MAYKITDSCVACGSCIGECPVEAISAGDIYVIDADKCIDLGNGVCFLRFEKPLLPPNNQRIMGDLEKMKAGLWLHAICPEIGGALLRTEELVFRLNQLPPSRREEREAIIRQLFGHVGKSVCIHSPFHCDFGAQISVGDHFVGNFNLTILDEAPVTIGDHVFIGPNVGIYTVNHALLPDQRNAGIMRSLPIAIGNNVWIGGHTVVMQGVTIGDNTVIGAGSVVTHDIPAGVVAVGSPCRVLRKITEADRVTPV